MFTLHRPIFTESFIATTYVTEILSIQLIVLLWYSKNSTSSLIVHTVQCSLALYLKRVGSNIVTKHLKCSWGTRSDTLHLSDTKSIYDKGSNSEFDSIFLNPPLTWKVQHLTHPCQSFHSFYLLLVLVSRTLVLQRLTWLPIIIY